MWGLRNQHSIRVNNLRKYLVKTPQDVTIPIYSNNGGKLDF